MQKKILFCLAGVDGGPVGRESQENFTKSLQDLLALREAETEVCQTIGEAREKIQKGRYDALVFVTLHALAKAQELTDAASRACTQIICLTGADTRDQVLIIPKAQGGIDLFLNLVAPIHASP